MEVSRWIREHLEHVELLALGALRGIRIRHVKGSRVLPDLLPLRLDLVGLVPIHCASRNEKTSRVERPWEAVAASPRCFPGVQKQLLHCPDCSNAVASRHVDFKEVTVGRLHHPEPEGRRGPGTELRPCPRSGGTDGAGAARAGAIRPQLPAARSELPRPL